MLGISWVAAQLAAPPEGLSSMSEAHSREAVEVHRVVRRRGSQMAVSLSALRAGRRLPPGRFLVLILLEAGKTSGL